MIAGLYNYFSNNSFITYNSRKIEYSTYKIGKDNNLYISGLSDSDIKLIKKEITNKVTNSNLNEYEIDKYIDEVCDRYSKEN